MNCKNAVVPKDKASAAPALCEACTQADSFLEAAFYAKTNLEYQSLQEEFKYLWTECQRCRLS